MSTFVTSTALTFYFKWWWLRLSAQLVEIRIRNKINTTKFNFSDLAEAVNEYSQVRESTILI